MSSINLLPLEILLQRKASDICENPNTTDNLFETYTNIVGYLRRNIYPLIDVGLAALSEEAGFYTLHGSEHFDEVVKYAGYLLGYERGDEDNICPLNAYELYVLLLAIRLHDAGNAYGRERHEKRAFFILNQMGVLAGSDTFEKRLIADIAEAHGGKTLNNSKDTIGQLTEKKTYGSVDIRPRLLAALVRFADEICENRRRAANLLLDNQSLPKHSEVYHKYASSIKSVKVRPSEKLLDLRFAFSIQDLIRKWGKKKTEHGVEEVFLTDEIFERLEKMFIERQYCNKFMREICNIERMRIDIEIYNPDDDHRIRKNSSNIDGGRRLSYIWIILKRKIP
jgi:hypothetical protein